MATIGLSIESGALTAVLFDSVAGAVLASQATSLDGGGSSSLVTAVESMKAVASRRSVGVDGIGLVYHSDTERDRFAAAVEGGELDGVTLISASAAFLGWLARSPEFESAQCVLLYYMSATEVSLALVDAARESLSPPKTAVLESMSPEQIGSTVPLAWEVLDTAGRTPDSVALFGDPSGNKDLIDILELGLGVPVVRVGSAHQIAARGASMLAANGAAKVATPVVLHARTTAAMAPEVSGLPRITSLLSTVPAANITLAKTSNRRAIPRKKLVLTAALLAAVLSGGVALASTLPKDAPRQSDQNESIAAGATDADTSLAGATQRVELAKPAPSAVPAPPVIIDTVAQQPVAIDPVTQLPVYAPAPVQQWTVDPATGVARSEALTPIPSSEIPPAAAVVPRATVDPPVFAVPTVLPEAGKSAEQLEQEAWDRHWQHTAQWLEQEIVGN
ncbi:hypothetical protein QMK17_23535 [Rhodococcus sp. G-MC3]|uniref:hypothetical protein n=1 Tax=Rhodococcus sp. G-MC3 TaxID=3046209 RepID=UPI0024B9CB61|nr:hypothetical protein [Rhodococcus sp. G-MC3]MDJ0396282.1 hypothetical protein [Rhodococcus sp. G-MC3]